MQRIQRIIVSLIVCHSIIQLFVLQTFLIVITNTDKHLSIAMNLQESITSPPIDVSIDTLEYHVSNVIVHEADINHIFTNQIIIEVIFSFGLVLIGQLLPLKLSPVQFSPDILSKTFEEATGRPEFNTYNHRGLLLQQRLSSIQDSPKKIQHCSNMYSIH